MIKINEDYSSNFDFVYDGHGFHKYNEGSKKIIELGSVSVRAQAESTDGKNWKFYHQNKLKGSDKCSSDNEVAEKILIYSGLNESIINESNWNVVNATMSGFGKAYSVKPTELSVKDLDNLSDGTILNIGSAGGRYNFSVKKSGSKLIPTNYGIAHDNKSFSKVFGKDYITTQEYINYINRVKSDPKNVSGFNNILIKIDESINESLKPDGGDEKNFWMFYIGPGYANRERKDIEKFGRDHKCTVIWWGSDTGYKLAGSYNGDTLCVAKDINKLPFGYKKDAMTHGKRLNPDEYFESFMSEYDNEPINEDISVDLTHSERSAIDAAVAYDARAGIIEASDIQKALDRASNNKVKFTKHDVEYLNYWNDLLKNHPNSPKVKFMDQDLKTALFKIFK